MSKKLLFSLTRKDFEIITQRGHGKGGQHRNTTDSAVRVIHKESGAQGYSQDQRSQYVNKKKAFERCCNSAKFKVWLNKKIFDTESREDIDKLVDAMMEPKNIKVEVKNENDDWVALHDSE